MYFARSHILSVIGLKVLLQTWHFRGFLGIGMHDYSVVVTVTSDISDPRFFISRRSLTASREGPDPSESEEVTS